MDNTVKDFVPTKQPARFPIGPQGRSSSQIEFYERLTDKNLDLRDISVILEPIIVAAQMQPIELCDTLTKALTRSER